MKIKLLAAFILTASIASAQDIKFGVKAGLNLSKNSTSGTNPFVTSTDIKPGFIIGGVIAFDINEKFTIQPEILFVTEGGKQSYVGIISDTSRPTTYDYSQNISLNSLVIPIMVKYNISKSISIDAGPQIGYILSAKSKLDINTANGGKIYGDNDLSSSSSVLFSDFSNNKVTLTHDYQLSKLNFGFNLGGTYNLDNGLFIQARFNLGLTSFVKNANLLAGVDEDSVVIEPKLKGSELKNSNFQLTLGYNFK